MTFRARRLALAALASLPLVSIAQQAQQGTWPAKPIRIVVAYPAGGVSDVVDPFGGEIYDSDEFHERADRIMTSLLKALPNWIRCAFWG